MVDHMVRVHHQKASRAADALPERSHGHLGRRPKKNDVGLELTLLHIDVRKGAGVAGGCTVTIGPAPVPRAAPE